MTSVITTINYPTEAVKYLADKTDLIIVLDEKSPDDFWMTKGCKNILGLKNDGRFSILHHLPQNHYSRKNIGYLQAIKNGAKVIYDTDDDNIPNENWKERTVEVEAAFKSNGNGWYNIYNRFCNENIWPRGFSLKNNMESSSSYRVTKRILKSSIQQGLANGEPDVDAIWRIAHGKRLYFEGRISLYLSPGAWCPFNSQSTWWFPKAYPLMYLPITASFRMTDIWRSFVAQRCLWEMGEGVTFHSPAEVFQDRNKHDLLKDFEQEIPGYLLNDKIVEILSGLTLNGDVFSNMRTCYGALVDNEIMPPEELKSLNVWIKDLEKIYGNDK